MLGRIEKGSHQIRFISEGVKAHPTVILLKAQLRYKSLTDYIDMTLAHFRLVDVIGIDDEYQDRFNEVINFILSLKSAVVEFESGQECYDIKDYLSALKSLPTDRKGVTFEPYETLCHQIKLVNAVGTMDDIEEYPEEATYTCDYNESYRDYRYNIRFPKEIHDIWKTSFAVLIEDITGDFDKDLFKAWIQIISKGLNPERRYHDESRDFLECGVHLEVFNAFKKAVQTLVYMVNCSSYQGGRLECFDRIEIDFRIQESKMYLPFLENQIEFKLKERDR